MSMPSKEILVGVHRSTCIACGTSFDQFLLSDLQYGERFFYSSDGRACAYMNYLEDPAVKEISGLFDEISECGHPNLFGAVVVATADPLKGITLDPVRTAPSCPRCGAQSSHTEPEPFKTAHVVVPVLSYQMWVTLATEQKKALVKKAVEAADAERAAMSDAAVAAVLKTLCHVQSLLERVGRSAVDGHKAGRLKCHLRYLERARIGISTEPSIEDTLNDLWRRLHGKELVFGGIEACDPDLRACEQLMERLSRETAEAIVACRRHPKP